MAKFPDSKKGGKVAPKTASPGAGACDGGAAADLAKAAKSINKPKKGGLPAN